MCDFKSSDSWVILSPLEQSIKRKVEAIGTPLRDWDINIYRGVLTGFNEAYIIDSNKREEILANCTTPEEKKRTAELIRPILRGKDIKRYGYVWANKYLIATFPSKHYDIDIYPAVKQYLLSIGMEKLEQTGKTYKRNGETIRARKKTNNKWFETQDSISYWDDFFKPKIVWASVGDIEYSLIPDNFLLLDTNYFFAIKSTKELLAILNSKLLYWWIAMEDTPIGGGGAYRHYKYNLEKISIPSLSRELVQELDSLVNQIIDRQKCGECTSDLENTINNHIYKIYNLSPSEIEYIENREE